MSELADSNISVVNNVFVKQMVFPYVGYTAVTHAHIYDHQTLLAKGALRLTVGGVSTDYMAPTMLLITAGTLHGMTALEDGTVAYCIHILRHGDTVDEAAPLVKGLSNHELRALA